MRDLSDSELLSKWCQLRSEQAFAGLVGRYAGLVYHAALRVCRDESLAAEASQLAFVTLARKAASLTGRDSLAGWLHITGTMQARNLLQLAKRENRKRDELEQHLATMNPGDHPTGWQSLAPVLDEALAALSMADRQTILLRHYRALSVREIASSLSISADAAQKRLDRAMDRLRVQLTRRGCASVTGLGTVLSAGFASNAEAGLAMAPSFSSAAIQAARGTGASAFLTFSSLIMTKHLTFAIAALALLIGTAAWVVSGRGHAGSPDTSASPSTPGTRIKPFPQAPPASTATAAKDTFENLVATYGEARAHRSRKVAEAVIAQANIAFGFCERLLKSQTFGLRNFPIRRSFELSDEQMAMADRLVGGFIQRQLVLEKQQLEKITRNPLPLVELLLASDACFRGDLPNDRYASIRAGLADQVRILGDPVGKDGRSFSLGIRGSPQDDPAFVSQFRAILDHGQLAAFDEDLKTYQKSAAENRDASTLASLEPTDLEFLARKTEATLKLISGMSEAQEGGYDFSGDDDPD